MKKLTRRGILSGLGGGLALSTKSSAMPTKRRETQRKTSQIEESNMETSYVKIYRADSRENLPVPENTPALGVTSDGFYEWLAGDLEWEYILESLSLEEFNKIQIVFPEENCSGIQQAINALPDTGGKVILLEGTYEVEDGKAEEAAIFVNKDNVTIEGQGHSTKVFLPDGITEPGKGKAILDIGRPASRSDPLVVNGCLLKDFLIDGNMQNQNPDEITDLSDMHNIEVVGSDHKFSNLWSVNSTGDGLELTSKQDPPVTTNITVVNCTFHENNEHCIHFHGCQNVTVSNCILDGERQATVVSTWTNKTDNKDITLDGCQILNGKGRSGVEIKADTSQIVDGNQWKTRGFRMSDCFIAYNDGLGLMIDGRFSEDIEIKNCTFLENGTEKNTHNVKLEGGKDVEIIDCSIKHGWMDGLLMSTARSELTDVVIKGGIIKNNNQKSGSFPSGIAVEVAGNDITRLRVTNLDVVSSDNAPSHHYGVRIIERSPAVYTDVDFSGLYIKNVKKEEWYNVDIIADYLRDNTPTKPTDVRRLKQEVGNQAYHDGSGGNTAGPAFYDSSVNTWTSLVDGTPIK
ncbi:right-handed parallel beta-helix repeat-containing protein [Halegenticoccus tardaugens]|uniref:right-handed parallel beta-helix repeat-containing protein n=1 Tax=Halegenticoccus tardaugens TaxID=2071624 RepID=UPI00100ABB29|nr:right-handed parallel beta-helix repeat-containing protein [Halegenticoccus tardaugens]